MKISSAFIFSLSLATVALGNGSRLPSQDAWVVARGYAATAGVSSSASVYYNPAGLAGVTSPEVRAGLHVIDSDISFRSAATGLTTKEQSDPFLQPHVFAAVPISPDVTLGLGVYSPFGQSTDWPVTSGFGGLATFNEVEYITGAAALSWRLSSQLSVGAGLQYNRAKVDLNRLTALAPGVITAFRFSGDDTAVSGNIGLKWALNGEHTIGVHYQRHTNFNFSGDAELRGVMTQAGSVDWAFPENVALGWEWKFAPTWTAEIAIDWTNWNRVGTLQLNAGPLSTAVPLEWESSSYYGIGVTHALSKSLSVNVGYNFSENSIPDASFTPALPDVDRHLLGAGLFWNNDRWEIGALIQRGFTAHRDVRGPAPDGLGGSAAGRFENGLWAGELSAAFRF